MATRVNAISRPELVHGIPVAKCNAIAQAHGTNDLAEFLKHMLALRLTSCNRLAYPPAFIDADEHYRVRLAT
jgi:hypothetical protein